MKKIVNKIAHKKFNIPHTLLFTGLTESSYATQ